MVFLLCVCPMFTKKLLYIENQYVEQTFCMNVTKTSHSHTLGFLFFWYVKQFLIWWLLAQYHITLRTFFYHLFKIDRDNLFLCYRLVYFLGKHGPRLCRLWSMQVHKVRKHGCTQLAYYGITFNLRSKAKEGKWKKRSFHKKEPVCQSTHNCS